MKLVSITLERFKRFEQATMIDVAGGVIALVGPNEAGKSTILDAMLSLDDTGEFTRREKTRHSEGITRVRARYVLDDEDRAALDDIPGGNEVRWWTLEKWAQGDKSGRYFRLWPEPKRDLRQRHQLADSLRDFAHEEQLTPRFGSVGSVVIADLYEGVLASLTSTEDTLTEDQIEEVQLFASTMFRFGDICAEPIPGSSNQYVSEGFCTLLRQLQEYGEGLDPYTQAGQMLEKRRPTFVMFTEEDRDLRTTYDLSKVGNDPPVALANLLQLSDLDLPALARSINEGDSGRRETLLERAKNNLRDIFKKSWKQSDLTVLLALRGSVLEILVSTPGGGYNELQERSTGLRTFVALRAFLAKKGVDMPPILLVDEAEQHLHYDAQADLVGLFTEQRLAAKVIYSTHSAGCLPRDLGTGIRVVTPEAGTERSTVENSVWGGRKAGFTPLIYGMGATTFAFLPARFVVIGEGPSDAMLYPTLFREAVGVEPLSFQVAPGLANIAPAGLPLLKSEGGTVAFVTDGDKDGRRYRKTLEGQSVPSEVIFGLDQEFGEPLHLEDLIDPHLYATVVNELLRDFQNAKTEFKCTSIPPIDRLSAVARWCKQNNLKPPEKIHVAQRLLDKKLEAAREDKTVQILSRHRVEGVVKLYLQITAIFKSERVRP